METPQSKKSGLFPKTLSLKVKGVHANWWWALGIVAVWVYELSVAGMIPPYYASIVLYSGINIILAVSLNLVNGFTGQFSMAHAGFMSVGAYTSAFITVTLRAQYPGLFDNPFVTGAIFVGSMILGGLMSCLVGYLVGLPSLRLKGDYLAIVTLGFGEIIRVIFLNMNAVGGARGWPGIPHFTNFGWIYTFVIITIFVVSRLVRSAQGRAFLSVREDEIAAEAMGVNVTKAKVRAFVIAAFFAGVAGGLFAHQLQVINPVTFDFNKSFEIIIMVVLGGMGSISGSVVAAIFLTTLKEALRPLQEITRIDFRMVIYSLMLIILMLNRPTGIFGSMEISEWWRLKRERRAAKRAKREAAP